MIRDPLSEFVSISWNQSNSHLISGRSAATVIVARSLCLGLDRRGAPFDLGGVAEVAPRTRTEAGVELVNARHAGRDVELHDLVVPQPVEVLDQRPQAVAVRRYEHAGMEQQVGRASCRERVEI